MNKPVLILISGWAHAPSVLRQPALKLSGSFRVLPVSTGELWLNGGRSYTDGLDSMLRSVGEPAIVAGWSMGGMVALETAARGSCSISAMVLIGACARFCSAPDAPEGVHPARLRAMKLDLKRNRKRMLSRFFEQAAAPMKDDAIEEKILSACEMDPEELRGGLDYLLRFDVIRKLDSLNIPVLALHGRADRIVPWQASEFLDSCLPNSRFVLDEETGHALPVQKPDFIVDKIGEFMEMRS